MLVLKLKPHEKIYIADGEIVVQLLDLRGGSVRLGITAPDDIRVDRKVIHERRQAEKARAAS